MVIFPILTKFNKVTVVPRKALPIFYKSVRQRFNCETFFRLRDDAVPFSSSIEADQINPIELPAELTTGK